MLSLCSRVPPERSLYHPLVPQFLWLPLGTPVDHLALTARGAYARGSHRSVTNAERFLNNDHPQGTQQEVTDPGPQSLCERNLLAYLHSSRLLIKHTSKGWL